VGHDAPADVRPLGAAARLALAGLGAGWLPAAPGTWGSLLTAGVIAVALPQATAAWWATLGLLVAGSLACLAWGGRAVRPDGRGDPGWVVADEVAGQALALVGLLPFVAGRPLLACAPWVAVAFVLFRVLDITKPGPIRRLERLPGGLGVLADDLGAGLAAGLLTAAALSIA
jgi:phosphatidylglycerophosphatase A